MKLAHVLQSSLNEISKLSKLTSFEYRCTYFAPRHRHVHVLTVAAPRTRASARLLLAWGSTANRATLLVCGTTTNVVLLLACGATATVALLLVLLSCSFRAYCGLGLYRL